MHMSSPRPVVHLELHTGDHARASALYAKLLCWRQELIEAGSGSYLALGLGGGFGGGIVECGSVIAAPQCGELAIWQPKP
jgi:predicted enzyme related to lactoylglutathione lyase